MPSISTLQALNSQCNSFIKTIDFLQAMYYNDCKLILFTAKALCQSKNFFDWYSFFYFFWYNTNNIPLSCKVLQDKVLQEKLLQYFFTFSL